MSDLQADLARVREADASLAQEGRPVPLALGSRLGQVVGVLRGASEQDWWLPSLRDRAGAVLRGTPVERLLDGSVGARPYRVVPPGGAPALRALWAVGLARSGEGAAIVHLGPGSVSDGAFMEALELAVRYAARVVFVVDQPDLSSAPVPAPCVLDLRLLAASAGVPLVVASSDDPEAIAQATSAARQRSGPTLLLIEP